MKFSYFLSAHVVLAIILTVASMVVIVIGCAVLLQSQRKSTRLGGLFTFAFGTIAFITIGTFASISGNFYLKRGSVIQGTFLGQRLSGDGTNHLERVFKMRDGNILIIKHDQNWQRKTNNTANLVKNKAYTISYRYETLKPKLKPTKEYPSMDNVHVTGYTANSSLIHGKWAQSNHVGHVISLNKIIDAQQNN